ncbi:hypothetical protein [Mycolicibacterium sphagni]|uniref:Uncharacterized protein n=1 Tax=Mycolicibacterium sphagni TaxID=1786 RepID=A0A255D8N3_9MYCO|nr:hypothetical protein [Mycolicibacterium sphagni]MCV7176511.1 hypothetical protein [Mycolicibacterium sphagni]OYN75789.1 hypothetical protein CG716_24530 [Mycolicibacterium sphagni]
MSAFQWVIGYLCIAALVAGSAVVLAAWSQRTQESVHTGFVPALLAGALWPLVVVGSAQWLLVCAIAQTLRREQARIGEAVYYGPPHRSTVDAA